MDVASAEGETLGFADEIDEPLEGTEPQATSTMTSVASAATLMFRGFNIARRPHRVVSRTWCGTFGTLQTGWRRW